LNEHVIGANFYYPLFHHLQKCFEFLGRKAGDFSISKNLTKIVLILPIFQGFTEKKQKFVIETTGIFINKNKERNRLNVQ